MNRSKNLFINVQPFVVLCGLDGSGKTTVLNKLTKVYNEILVTHWGDLNIRNDQNQKEWFQIGDNPAKYVQTLSPIQRSLYLSSMVWNSYENLIQPALYKPNKFVISDSYFYKIWAKEKVYNLCDPIFYELCLKLPRPQKIIFLDVKPEESYKRKTEISEYETNGSSYKDYINFQSHVRYEILNILSNINNNNIVFIDANGTLDSTYNNVLKTLDL